MGEKFIPPPVTINQIAPAFYKYRRICQNYITLSYEIMIQQTITYFERQQRTLHPIPYDSFIYKEEEEDDMSDLLPLLAATIRDKVVADALEEIESLKQQLQQFKEIQIVRIKTSEVGKESIHKF